MCLGCRPLWGEAEGAGYRSGIIVIPLIKYPGLAQLTLAAEANVGINFRPLGSSLVDCPAHTAPSSYPTPPYSSIPNYLTPSSLQYRPLPHPVAMPTIEVPLEVGYRIWQRAAPPPVSWPLQLGAAQSSSMQGSILGLQWLKEAAD